MNGATAAPGASMIDPAIIAQPLKGQMDIDGIRVTWVSAPN
jgi:hypothetical protein